MRIYVYTLASLHRFNKPFRYAVRVHDRWVDCFAPGAVRARRIANLGLSQLELSAIAEMERRMVKAIKS